VPVVSLLHAAPAQGVAPEKRLGKTRRGCLPRSSGKQLLCALPANNTPFGFDYVERFGPAARNSPNESMQDQHQTYVRELFNVSD
jgi:hypothetical protein